MNFRTAFFLRSAHRILLICFSFFSGNVDLFSPVSRARSNKQSYTAINWYARRRPAGRSNNRWRRRRNAGVCINRQKKENYKNTILFKSHYYTLIEARRYSNHFESTTLIFELNQLILFKWVSQIPRNKP